jgi:hypothetical protein
MNFFNSKNKTTYKILFDFRNSSLAFAVLKIENNNYKIIDAERQAFYFKKIDHSNIYIETFYKALSEKSSKITRKFPELAKEKLEIEILLSSPWYDCKIKNFDLEKKQETKITVELLNDLINKNIIIESEQKLIENKVINLRINGYIIENPINKKFTKLDFNNYQSFISKDTERDLLKIISENFNQAKINFHTHPVVLFTNFKNHFHNLSNFMIFDFGGELTELIQVTQNRIKSIYTIPFGTHYFVRKLTDNFNYSTSLAWSKLDIINDGHLDEKNEQFIDKFLLDFKKEWLRNIKTTFQKHQIQNTPANILIVSDQKFQKIVKNTIDDPLGWADALKNNRKPETQIIDESNVLNKIKYEKDSEKDTILSLFCNYLIINS